MDKTRSPVITPNPVPKAVRLLTATLSFSRTPGTDIRPLTTLAGFFAGDHTERSVWAAFNTGECMTAIIEEMEEAQTCAICRIRRPRRYCPGVGGNICPVCCGTERERTVSCPLDCPYLRESRLRERDHIVDQGAYPNPDIQISEEFLASREALLVLTASGLAQAALSETGSLDNDVKAALESLIQTLPDP